MELDFPISIENWLNLSTTAHVTHVTHVVVANYDSVFLLKITTKFLQITTIITNYDRTPAIGRYKPFPGFTFLSFF